ncbi:MAG: aldo/keto reductase [Christensenellaceae bacterium]|jgi:L-glyceraldehyde 3-phosphate reductase|nr:aldo/keto reductase [Christensenellaceae bacterium]
MTIKPNYDLMQYKTVGNSGLKLPLISLGLWHNFGDAADPSVMRDIILSAFNGGVTHFDLANNYGPIAGAAEQNFGKILKNDLITHRDELIISTKAGYYMWQGPYGDGGSKKYLVASLDQSLARMGLDYVDIFYHHRRDTQTPIAETAAALDLIVRQGKALYIGISNYNAADTRAIYNEFKRLNTPFIIHQPCYNLLNRGIESGLTDALDELGLGCIPFSPLAQGILTDRYLRGIPVDSRVNTSNFLPMERVSEHSGKVVKLAALAKARGVTTAQLALLWLLSNKTVTSVIVGASRLSQLDENLASARLAPLTDSEKKAINAIFA